MWLAESYEYSDDYKTLTIKTRPERHLERRRAVLRRRRRLHLQPARRSRSGGASGAPTSSSSSTRPRRPTRTPSSATSRCPRRASSISSPTSSTSASTSCRSTSSRTRTSPTFTFFDIEKGWPVTTGPWRVVYSAPEQKVLDRADDWWGVAAGVAELPAPKRFVYLPDPGRAGAGLRHHRQPVRHRHRHPAGELRDRLRRQRQGHHLDRAGVAVRQHRLVAALALPQQRESSPGAITNVRWAISYYLDREQIIDIAWMGASLPSTLFVPDYPPLQAVPRSGPAD